jgi:Holliday junction DNA helicase RuvA
MIAFLKGTIEAKHLAGCLLDVAGVGYEVLMPKPDLERLSALGANVTLHTWHVTREDGEYLFGFLDPEDRQLFKLLLNVSGVGPKVALAVLSGLNRQELEQAVAAQDSQALSRVPGIGKKTAERLLLELKDKLSIRESDGSRSGLASVSPDMSDALEALQQLGYPLMQAKSALVKAGNATAGQSGKGSERVASLIREALKYLG